MQHEYLERFIARTPEPQQLIYKSRLRPPCQLEAIFYRALRRPGPKSNFVEQQKRTQQTKLPASFHAIDGSETFGTC